MFELNKITRPNIQKLEAYSSARDEYSKTSGVFLDANENPYGELNRYPDPYQKELKDVLYEKVGIKPVNTFIGNGSDEVIDLLFRVFCEPSIDKALCFYPSYGMYEVSAGINNVELIRIPLNASFDIDFNTLKDSLEDPFLKLILICSPNNPTGNCADPETVERIIKSFKGIVFIDEAYVNFSDKNSFTKWIDQYPNLVVGQTMSKAWGLAAARIGMAFGNLKIISLLNKVKPPYNISALNQKAAIQNLERIDEYRSNKKQIDEDKKKLYRALQEIKSIVKIYPSDSNFFLVQCKDANRTYNELVKNKIIIRNRSHLIENCIRITVGSNEENELLIKTLKSI